jgi:hypothetical protein
MTLEEKASQLKKYIHEALLELSFEADEAEKVLYVNIQVDYLCPVGNVGANLIRDCEIEVEEK